FFSSLPKKWQGHILFRDYSVLWRDQPIDIEIGIGEMHPSFGFLVIEIVAFIEKLSRIAYHRKTMEKSARHKELVLVFRIQADTIRLTIGFAARSAINDDIQHFSGEYTNQFGLRVLARLSMQSADNPIR